MLTLSQVNWLYDITSKMSGVWEQTNFYHHRHWGAFNLHLKNQQQMAALWKTWSSSITCDKAKTKVMEEGPAMEFPNLFFFLLTVTLQFTYSSEDTFTIHSYNYIRLNCALFVTCSSSNPWFFFSRAYVFSISDLRTMEIAKELTINLPKRFQIKHYPLIPDIVRYSTSLHAWYLAKCLFKPSLLQLHFINCLFFFKSPLKIMSSFMLGLPHLTWESQGSLLRRITLGILWRKNLKTSFVKMDTSILVLHSSSRAGQQVVWKNSSFIFKIPSFAIVNTLTCQFSGFPLWSGFLLVCMNRSYRKHSKKDFLIGTLVS